MKPSIPPLRNASLSALILGLAALIGASNPWSLRTYFGPAATIGRGTLQTYVTFASGGAPTALGVTLTSGALKGLPARKNTHSRCYDLDGSADYSPQECLGDEERILELPAEAAAMAELPFRWLTVNWNAEGHHPPPPRPGEQPAAPVYAKPHFDFHFYAWERERIEAIAPGRCSELVDCSDFERATKPIPAKYMPAGHVDLGIVVPRMGNHLLDSHSPELAPSPQPFTRTFIYGAFDGELIFWEPMITLDFLRRTTNGCFEIAQPRTFKRSGYYPTQYCVRYDKSSDRHSVSLEGFVYAIGR